MSNAEFNEQIDKYVKHKVDVEMHLIGNGEENDVFLGTIKKNENDWVVFHAYKDCEYIINKKLIKFIKIDGF